MRVMLNVSFPVATGNAAVKDGKLPRTFAALMDQLKPEATYFYPKDGKRHATWVFDLKDSAQIPLIAERLFQELDAEVELTPVMNYEDLKKGLGQIAPK